MKTNNFTIERTSWRNIYTVKELTQLYSQSKSEISTKKIRTVILLTKLGTWLWWIYVSIFAVIAVLIWLK